MTKEELKKIEAEAEKIRKIVGKFPPPDPLPPPDVEAPRGDLYKSTKEFGRLYRAKMLSDKK
ncbi:MAG: hypothetical protein K6E42_04075 [Synergistes sp.]|nr:hypothetical protein [Synergistes sp.]